MSAKRRRQGDCAACGRFGEIHARGLDKNCYMWAWSHRRLDQYQRVHTVNDDMLDEWKLYASAAGPTATIASIAGRMGVSKAALYVALSRARRRGDPRAVSLPTRQERRERAKVES